MTKHYSVGLPDGLSRRFEKYKGVLSPTAIFQWAVRKAITEREENAKRMANDDWGSVVRRLQHEKKKEIEGYFERGKKAGDNFLKTAPLKDIKNAVAIVWKYFRQPLKKDNQLGELSRYFGSVEEIKSLYGEALEEWKEGWIWEVGNLGKELLAQV